MDATFHDGRVELLAGDCLERLKGLPDDSVDAVATDPPYHLTSIVKRFGAKGSAAAKDYSGEREGATGAYARASKGFMGQTWDGGDIAFRVELWAEVFRVLKPGGHLCAFSGTRTYHRMAVAIEDAGFEIRDMIAWLYGTGFPKSHDVSKAIDKALGCERRVVSEGAPVKRMIAGADQARNDWEKTNGRIFTPTVTEAASDAARAWEGWGTALKPALEPICLARKPLDEGSIAANVLKHGIGAINIDACRVEAEAERPWRQPQGFGVALSGSVDGSLRHEIEDRSSLGRWPANVAHDGSDEVVEAFPSVSHSHPPANSGSLRTNRIYGADHAPREFHPGFSDSGSAARFFYSAKADADDRLGSGHPTVKPLGLMRWLVRLITPPGGRVLDPFAGTGSTGHAALLEGFSATLIEREEAYRADIARRLRNAFAHDRERRALIAKAKGKVQGPGALFEAEIALSGRRSGSSTADLLRTDNRADRDQAMNDA